MNWVTANPRYGDERQTLLHIKNQTNSILRELVANPALPDTLIKEQLRQFLLTHSLPSFDKHLRDVERETKCALESLIPAQKAYEKVQKQLRDMVPRPQNCPQQN